MSFSLAIVLFLIGAVVALGTLVSQKNKDYPSIITIISVILIQIVVLVSLLFQRNNTRDTVIDTCHYLFMTSIMAGLIFGDATVSLYFFIICLVALFWRYCRKLKGSKIICPFGEECGSILPALFPSPFSVPPADIFFGIALIIFGVKVLSA